MILKAVQRFGSRELLDEVLPGVYRGEVRFAMGYTEPEGGSDIATCKTRALRDGDEWIINGQKMFTSGAHNCAYIFLLTNTDPNGRRHHNLTMFLVPTDSTGIDIQGLRSLPVGATHRHRWRHHRRLPQHDRPVRARPRPTELLAAEMTLPSAGRARSWYRQRASNASRHGVSLAGHARPRRRF